MNQRVSVRSMAASAVATAWTMAGSLALVKAAPAAAHVDPNAPVSGPSVAGQSAVRQFGEAVSTKAAAGTGASAWWQLAAVVVVVVTVLACVSWAGWRALCRRRSAAVEGRGSAPVTGDAIDAELSRISHESRPHRDQIRV